MEAVLRVAPDLAPALVKYVEKLLRSRLEKGVVRVLTYFTVFLYSTVEEYDVDDFVKGVVDRFSCGEGVRDPLVDKVVDRYVCLGRTSFGLLVEKTTLEGMILGEEVFWRILGYIEDGVYEERANTKRLEEVAEELGINLQNPSLVKEFTLTIYAQNPRAEDLADLIRTLYDEVAHSFSVEHRVIKIKVFAEEKLRTKIAQNVEKRFSNRVKVYRGEELVIIPNESIATDVELYRSILEQHVVLGGISRILGKP